MELSEIPYSRLADHLARKVSLDSIWMLKLTIKLLLYFTK